MIKKIFLILTIGMSALGYCQESEKVPYGEYILSNGILEKPEWLNSKVINIDSSINLLIKQDNKNVFIGIEFLKEKHTGVDLYLANINEERYMFHVSSTQGEKKFTNNTWSETVWELPKYWHGNTIGLYQDNKGKRQIIKPDGFEFLISKKLITSNKFRIKFHLKRPIKIFPKNTNEIDINSWYEFEL
jgi:hypothetical protein